MLNFSTYVSQQSNLIGGVDMVKNYALLAEWRRELAISRIFVLLIGSVVRNVVVGLLIEMKHSFSPKLSLID